MIVAESGEKLPVSELLAAVLVCPKDRADLRSERGLLVCTECGASYPVEDGLPNMLDEHE